MSKPIKKNIYITIKASRFEKKMMQTMAKESGLDLSKYLRAAGLKKNIKTRLTDVEIELYKELIKIHNVWKSIGNLYSNRDPKFKSELHNLAEEVRIVLKKFQ